MTDHKSFVFRFGEFEVREREFLLIKGGEATSVEPKAFRVLLFLLRNPGRLIKKDEILNAVWSDTAVSDNSLTRSIATLRRVLGDDSREPRYIATVQTIGYRFLCPVEVVDGWPVQLGGSPADSPSDPVPLPRTVENFGRSKWLVLGLTFAFMLVAGGWIVRRSMQSRAPAASAPKPAADLTASSHLRITPLTNLSGAVWSPAFSPDAKQIAFMWDGENIGIGDLYVQLIGGEVPLRLTHFKGGHPDFPAWSLDGREIAFGHCDDDGGAVYTVPALGGAARKITNVTCTFGEAGSPNWTADGKSLVLADRCNPGGPIGIVLFSMETGMKRCLTAAPTGDELGDFMPVLSPDQKTVAFARFPTAAVSDIYTVPLRGGSARRLTYDNKSVWALMWSSDGQNISFISSRGGLDRIWRISAEGGMIEPETMYPNIGAISRDGKQLVYVNPPGLWSTSSAIWRAGLSTAGATAVTVRQLLPDSSENYSPQPSPDGRQLAFESRRAGDTEIYKCDTDGSNPVRLTSLGGHAGTPRWSPDGKWIAFDYRPSAQSQIFAIDREGRNLHVVAAGKYENLVPSWSIDGKAIYFASSRTGRYQIWRRDLATGREMQITRNGGFAGIESFDGMRLYYSKFDDAGIWSVPLTGGEEGRITNAPHVGYWGNFAVTEDGLYIVDSEREHGPEISYYDFRSKRLSRVLKFNPGQHAVPLAANLGASRDGRTVFFTQGTSKSSLVLAENLR